jgi:hypothetical protein
VFLLLGFVSFTVFAWGIMTSPLMLCVGVGPWCLATFGFVTCVTNRWLVMSSTSSFSARSYNLSETRTPTFSRWAFILLSALCGKRTCLALFISFQTRSIFGAPFWGAISQCSSFLHLNFHLISPWGWTDVMVPSFLLHSRPHPQHRFI